MTRPLRPRLCRCGHRWEAHQDSMAGAPCGQCACADWEPGQPIPRRKRPEADAMRGVVKSLHLAGFRVWSTVQGYRKEPGGTRVAPGLPDYYAVQVQTGHVLWIEGKSRTGKLRPAQAAFRDLHQRHRDIAAATGQQGPPPVFVWRDRSECESWLQAEGLMIVRDGRVVYPHASGAE